MHVNALRSPVALLIAQEVTANLATAAWATAAAAAAAAADAAAADAATAAAAAIAAAEFTGSQLPLKLQDTCRCGCGTTFAVADDSWQRLATRGRGLITLLVPEAEYQGAHYSRCGCSFPRVVVDAVAQPFPQDRVRSVVAD
jgi:hypothetical protein